MSIEREILPKISSIDQNRKNQFDYRSNKIGSLEDGLSIASMNSGNQSSNGFRFRKPPRPKQALEPFIYNERPSSPVIPPASAEYELNSPYSSKSLNELDKNIFLSQRKLVVLNKIKPDNKIKPEPFSYNKEVENVPSLIKSYNIHPCPPFALHSSYLQVIQSKTDNSDETIDACLVCNRLINNKHELFIFKNNRYHKRCFRCKRCHSELFMMKKIMNDPNSYNEFFCEKCFEEKYSPRCSKCSQIIPPYMVSTTFDNNIYHKECFYCQRCKTYMGNEKYFKMGKLILCRNCL